MGSKGRTDQLKPSTSQVRFRSGIGSLDLSFRPLERLPVRETPGATAVPAFRRRERASALSYKVQSLESTERLPLVL